MCQKIWAGVSPSLPKKFPRLTQYIQFVKSGQKIWPGPSPPLIWTKSKRTATFFPGDRPLVCWIDWAATCKDQVNPGSPLASFFGFGSRCQLWVDEEKKELDALSLRLPRYQPVKDAYNRLEACKVDWATVPDSNIDISSWARKHSGSRPTSQCTTIGGGDPGASCAFPFIYLDLEYHGWAPCICVFYKV